MLTGARQRRGRGEVGLEETRGNTDKGASETELSCGVVMAERQRDRAREARL